jgi:hypothetical protein
LENIILKYITFFRESNEFTDILNDPTVKKSIDEKTTWNKHLLLGVVDDDKLISYITLKYGESIRTNLTKDYSPIPYVDYIPVRR